ncbi:MAG: prolyl oligopeptidase family serine peptidase [Rhodoferax sp.]|nr:prolyl oligopeptidase family serine peptidase [Rhodoferax sp.]
MTDYPTSTLDDSFLWLGNVLGEKPLAWVRERNSSSMTLLKARPEFEPARSKVLEILNSKDKIPYIHRLGDHVYNFWMDEKNQRGLWRRTTLADFKNPSPNWEKILDIDALGKAEKQSWVWGGADCLGPNYQRCLVSLSPGGSDAMVVREFDLTNKQFVASGFTLAEAKSHTTWIDQDTLLVGTDFGPGSMTKSGYPRIIKRWTRGTPLAAATQVFEAQDSDVRVYASSSQARDHKWVIVGRAMDFYNDEIFLLKGDQLIKIDKPTDASFVPNRQWAAMTLRSDWSVGGTTYKAGSLLITRVEDYLAGRREFSVLFEPDATTSLAGYDFSRNHVLVNTMDKVKSRLAEWTQVNGKWSSRVVNLPQNGELSIGTLYDSSLEQDPLGDEYTISYHDFLTPDALMLGHAGSDERQVLKQLPQRFDATGMTVQQLFAKSKDGTAVPYFVVSPRGVKTDGTNPTLLYGYGGFEVSLQPFYSGSWGSNWLSKGGVFVVSNIRGGGEFGPTWHKSAIMDKKQNSYDDFAAVAEDLIARKITSPKHLGIMGGSNGGLLVGATFVQRPELFNAVVCQVPLLDMKRYHKLLAGNSWMAEYGNPDIAAEWEVISRYSPYQNVKAGVKYPRVFFDTSTKDDRVHPAHARKMVARMQEQGHDVLYYENIEGGHGGAADNAQRATWMGLEFAYLWMQLVNK